MPCGAVATFDYSAFVTLYPEFAAVPQARIEAFWEIAAIYLRNDGTGPVKKETVQATLLNMLTAHLLQINAVILAPDGSAQAGSTIVGRISSATEGSVSVQSEFDIPQQASAAWFLQTKYGAEFWQATAAYRTMRYVRPVGHGVGGLYGAAGFPGGQFNNANGFGPWAFWGQGIR